MYPFSLYESNESNGLVSIKELFENKEYANLLECAKINYDTKKEMLE